MSRPARITLLTSGPLCRNPRVLKEAETLARAGHDVTVVTIAYHRRFEAYDEDLLQGTTYHKIALDRVSTRPAIRLISFFERSLAYILRSTRIEHPAALGPYYALRRLVLSIPADLVIAHTELPFCIAADLLKKGRAISVDYEDWHSRDLLPDARSNRPLQLLIHTEAVLLRSARHTTTTSLALATALAKTYEGPAPAVVPNTFKLSPRPDPAYREAVPSFFWLSQTIGPGRGLEAFIAAWTLTRSPSRLVLLGDISDNYRATLTSLLSPSHLARFSILPLVAATELPALIGRHHIGLALEPVEPASRNLTITNKIFHYLDAGLAILATPTAGQREVFALDPSIGLMDDLSTPADLSSKLDVLLSNPDRLADMGNAARRLAQTHFCWEKNSHTLLGAVAHALRRPNEAA